MGTTNEKPGDGDTEAKDRRHEEAPDGGAGNALDVSTLDEISGGGFTREERPLIRHVELYDPDAPEKAVTGPEGKSGA